MKSYTPQELQDLLPAFIEDEKLGYPKGGKRGKERGAAIVACVLFTLWLRERELKDEQ